VTLEKVRGAVWAVVNGVTPKRRRLNRSRMVSEALGGRASRIPGFGKRGVMVGVCIYILNVEDPGMLVEFIVDVEPGISPSRDCRSRP